MLKLFTKIKLLLIFVKKINIICNTTIQNEKLEKEIRTNITKISTHKPNQDKNSKSKFTNTPNKDINTQNEN